MGKNVLEFNPNPIILIEHLNKSFGPVDALKDINITIPAGRIIGLLGPNGSGKTTLFKILAGLYNQYTGDVLIEGNRPSVLSKNIVSYLPDKPIFSMKDSPESIMKLYETFFKDFNRKKAEKMMENFNVNITNSFREMSKGMIDKVQISLVMAREAKLYLLDEPLGGVDVAGREVVLDTILDNFNSEGTIIIATHLISEVERLFDEVVVLKYGKIVAKDNVENIKAKYGTSLEGAMREMFIDEKIK